MKQCVANLWRWVFTSVCVSVFKGKLRPLYYCHPSSPLHIPTATYSVHTAFMADLSFIIGILGNIISLLVFTSPIKTFWGVYKKKSTENYRGDPYITTLLSTSLWTFYGLLKPNGLLVVTVNGAGAALQFIYVTLFLIYAPRDKKVRTAKLVALLDVGFLGLVIAVTLLAIHGKLRLTIVGVLCAGLTIGMYAAPLSVMRIVVKTKSVEYMPFLLSFFLFFNGGVWSAYAVLVKDFFIGVPNAIGFVLGSAQLIIYAMYRNKSAPENSTHSMEKEEEGSAHLVKGGGLEMRGYTGGGGGGGGDNDGDATSLKNRSLSRGKSLPKPSVNKQYSSQKIMKTVSLELQQLNCADYVDIEKGKVDGHP